MSGRAIIGLALALGAASAVFYGFPAIDIVVSQWIFTGENGPALALARWAGWGITIALLAGAVTVFVRRQMRHGHGGREMVYVLAVLAIGPGLIANALLKDNWGRARPREVIEFGGDKHFTPAWVISDQCAGNCSFVSGEGAFAFTIIALAMLAPAGYRRRRSMIAALAFGSAVSLVRMAQGAHFLSDSVIGALLVALTAALLHCLIFDRGDREADEP